MNHSLKQYITVFLKGIAMGIANVIPGVSGGTIALITGIFEKLIHSIKSFDLKAIKLLFSGKFKEFADYTNLYFLLSIFVGIGVSIISLAKILDYLFENHPVYIWSFFFGLILASVYFVGKNVNKWSISIIIMFVIGTATAIVISILNPATENDSYFYVFLCGIIAMCSMILPGLSGSFVLILMGNYKLVMISAINDINFKVLIPMIIGAVFGILAFSHLLSWIFKKFKDHTIALLTGFILGSLSILWPWKNEIYQIYKNGEQKVIGYDRFIPDTFDTHVLIALCLMILGIICIWSVEKFAERE